MSKFEELERIGRLRESGVLSEEEFQAEKVRLLEKRSLTERVEALDVTKKPPNLSPGQFLGWSLVVLSVLLVIVSI